MNNKGRKIGSKNIINQNLKKELTDIILDEFKKEVKQFPTMEPEKRMRLLINMLPYVLPKSNLSFEESEIQEMIIDKMTPEYKKLQLYFVQIAPEKKAQVLLSLMKQLNPTSTQQKHLVELLS